MEFKNRLRRRDLLGSAALASAATAVPTVVAAQQSANPGKLIFAEDFGVSPGAKDNSPALRSALAAAAKSRGSVVFEGSSQPYRFLSDIVVDTDTGGLLGIGGNVHLVFVSCGLVFSSDKEGKKGQALKDIKLSREGEPGPALTARCVKQGGLIRFTWSDIHILSSTGDGLLIEGSFLGAISGLWITRCGGAGIRMIPGNVANSLPLGANAVAFFGGEVQNCEWGIEATDTKGITFSGFAVEGNRAGGIWLRGDNRAFSFLGGYFENNAKAYVKKPKRGPQYCDVRIGDDLWQGPPNRNVMIQNAFFSDGKYGHRNAVYIDGPQKNVVFMSPHFWAYGSKPVFMTPSAISGSSGKIYHGSNERPDNRNVPMINAQPKYW